MTAPIVNHITRIPLPTHRLGLSDENQEIVGYADVLALVPREPGQLWERVADHDEAVQTPLGRYVASRGRIARRNGEDDRGALARDFAPRHFEYTARGVIKP